MVISKEEIKLRVCKKCRRELELTSEYFQPREKCKEGFSPKCWECLGRSFGDRQQKQKWTDKDIEILKEYYENTTNEELIEKYFKTRTVDQIVDFASKKLKLHKLKETTAKLFWSEEDEEFLKLNYHNMTSSELSLFINKTPKTIRHRAIKLGLRKDNGKKLLPFDNIIKKLKNNNIEIINILDDYNSRYSMFEIKCEKGHTHKTNYNSLYRIHFSCIYCNEENHNHGKIEYEELSKMFADKKYKLLTDESSYKNCRADLEFICEKHSEYGKQITNYLSIKYKESSCKYCQLENKMGENSSNWQGGVSNINEFLRTCIYEWKKKSMQDCNYKCVITGLDMDIIHHLYSFNKISEEVHILCNIDKKQEISNYTEYEMLKLRDVLIKLHFKYGLGVCLNETLHKLFHSLYGSYNNTSDQFEEFRCRYFNGDFDDELDDKLKSSNINNKIKEVI